MRKLSLLLVALLVVSTGAFAQVVLQPEIEVEATATWGINLDEETHGLANSAKATLSITFLEESTEEFGEGEVYGWIELDGFEIELEAEGNDASVDNALVVSTGEISARIYLAGPMAYIDILSAPDEVDEAGNFSKISQNIRSMDDTAGAATNVSLGFAPFAYGPADFLADNDLVLITETADAWLVADDDGDGNPVAGTEQWVPKADVPDFAQTIGKVALGFALPDLMNVEFGVLSSGDWDSNITNRYLLSIEAEIIAVPDFTITVVAAAEMDDDETIGGEGMPAGFGVGVEYSMPLTPDITLKPGLGFDFVTVDTGNDRISSMEFGFGLNLSWAGVGTDEDDETIFGVEDEVSSGLGLGVVYGIHDAGFLGGIADETVTTLAVKIGLFEDSGDDGLLPVIGGALILNYNMISGLEDAGLNAEDDYSELGLGIEVNADLGVIEPYAGLTFLITDFGGDRDWDDNEYMYLNVGTDINVIANTTFTIDYKSGELLNSDDSDDAGFGNVIYGGGYGASARESGQFSIKTKISF